MSHSEICPVCKGTGKIREYNSSFSPFGFNYNSGFNFAEKVCHGCQGKGWVTVTDINDVLKYDYTKRSYIDKNTNQ